MCAIKILIVEDEAIVAEDIALSLEKMGYQVLGMLDSGEIALAKLTAEFQNPECHPDLILMDIMLKDQMDGVETAQQIRDVFKIPVVYLTANADSNTLQRAKATVPFGYLLKPFKEADLRATIEIALSRHQAEIEVQKALTAAQTVLREAEPSPESEYLAIACHEFRTPLSVIKFSSEFLRSYGTSLPEEKKQLYLQRIQAASDNMNRLLEDVLVLGQANSGRLEHHPVALNVATFCQDLIDALQWTAGSQYSLHLLCEGNCEQVFLDEKLLWHLLNNLLSNAIKYSPQGGKIWLTVNREGNQIYFQVKDQGIGIPEMDQKRLFEPFHRAGNTGKIPGTGLGLAIVQRSIELMGGTIHLKSQVGQGTVFTVALPVQLQSLLATPES
ncbi:MAG: ATP-binding protein [Leptolyngbyaceae cyanobacterium bins.59]|nr:ATP-binding protein [Leptolyngbyaceae cyanobacterium bins.59]